MSKKIISLFLLIFVAVVSVYFVFVNEFSEREEIPEQRPGKVDRLAKTDREGVEENINGFGLEDDLQITQELEQEEEYGELAVSPREVQRIVEGIGSKSDNTVLEQYNSVLPGNIYEALQYFHYNISYDYFLITAENGVEIRETPDPAENIMGYLENLDKVSLLQRVEGKEIAGSNIWYRIAAEKNNQTVEGYVHSTTGIPRTFRFEEMKSAVDELRRELQQGELHFISNYKNENGTPPQEGPEAVDEYGYRVYHSAPAYDWADTEANYRYVPDGMLVRILQEEGDFYQVNIPQFNGNFYVPKQFIDIENSLDWLNHVVVVDREQQNQAAFELAGENLNLVSYTLATTGFSGEYSFETSPGLYKVLGKRERFEYLEKGSQEIAGYAPHAIRFSGGAYIHGVPVPYDQQNGQKIDPGFREYIQTIGTFPRSSMCVRNYTSHAEFLFNWMDTRHGAVIVI